MNDEITVLLADDHAMMREMLAQRLGGEFGVRVVAMVADADAAVQMAIQHTPTVVVMDIEMPGRHVFDAARTIRERCPDTQIVFLSAFFHDHYIEQALALRAAGYVTKGESIQIVIQAIHAVAHGGVYFSPDVQSRMVVDAGRVSLSQKPQTRGGTLSPREIEVLRYLARGMSKKEIARHMHLSERTVNRHSTNLMAKLDIHDRVELARFAIREGLAEA